MEAIEVTKTILEKLGKQEQLAVVHPDMAYLSQHDKQSFALLRRVGLGASDSSIVCEVNPWKKWEDLIKEKRSTTITEEELAIGEKENVRKGVDLESLNLQKFSEKFGIPIVKPQAMYKIKEHPQLTINFDGVTALGEELIPVEAKFCSMYASKYYDRTKLIKSLTDGRPYIIGSGGMQDHIEQASALYGVPSYYYTQLQQQMIALNAPFGYLSIIFDKGWDYGAYLIYKDTAMQEYLIAQSEILWSKVQRIEE